MKKTRLLSPLSLLLLLLMTSLAAVSAAAPAAPDDAADSDDAVGGTITGRVVMPDGKPLAHGFVAFFDIKAGDPQDFGSTHRSPTMIAFIGENGTFTTISMPPGTYYLGAIPRKKFFSGPPRPDEKRYSAFDDKGEYRTFTLKEAQELDLGTITVREPDAFPEIKEFFTVTGRVLKEDGSPYPGAVVGVKKDLNNPKALFISGKTDADGAYSLKIPPGKYFFIARESLTMAGRPKPGSYMGVLGQNSPVGVGGKSDEPAAFIIGVPNEEYTGVDITMFKVPIPDVKRKEIEAKVKAKELRKEDLPKDLPQMKAPVTKAVEGKFKVKK